MNTNISFSLLSKIYGKYENLKKRKGVNKKYLKFLRAFTLCLSIGIKIQKTKTDVYKNTGEDNNKLGPGPRLV